MRRVAIIPPPNTIFSAIFPRKKSKCGTQARTSARFCPPSEQNCLLSKMQTVMPDQVKNLYFLFNHWSEQYSKSPSSLQNLVLSMYRKGLDNLLTAHLPDTRFMDRYTNLDQMCSVRSLYKGCARLASGVNDLVNDIYDQNTVVEVF